MKTQKIGFNVRQVSGESISLHISTQHCCVVINDTKNKRYIGRLVRVVKRFNTPSNSLDNKNPNK